MKVCGYKVSSCLLYSLYMVVLGVTLRQALKMGFSKSLPIMGNLMVAYMSLSLVLAGEAKDAWKSAASIYEFAAKDIDGNQVSLDKYRGHVVLIVNVASQ